MALIGQDNIFLQGGTHHIRIMAVHQKVDPFLHERIGDLHLFQR
ncbi:Uncharacterised protein [Vibrio cholerae]|nr:Uncharacterised protein [Vibrio cholerae]